MNWSSWSQFIAMGGYGLYVWGSFGMCVVVLGMEVALIGLRRRGLKDGVHDAAVDLEGSGA